MTWPQKVSALTVEDKYYQAEACYRKLQKSSKSQKYRDRWLICIEKFQDVYRIDPTGRWAPAGLYMSGELYRKLYNISYKASDKREALDIFERIIRRFPQSQYRQKAAAAIRTFSKSESSRAASSKDRADKAQKARQQYAIAERCYQQLLGSPKSQKYRDRWLECIEKFQEVYRIDPSGSWAAAGLYMTGTLYQKLYERSFLGSDKNEALEHFQSIIKRYPQSQYRPKAAVAIRTFNEPKSSRAASSKDRAYKAQKARQQYAIAESCYQRLLRSPKSQKYRDRWLICIEKFQEVYRIDPSGSWAAAGLYMTGKLYQGLYQRSFKASDQEEARDTFERIIKDFPQSQYRRKAADAMDSFSQDASPEVASRQLGRKQRAPDPAVDTIAKEIEKAAATREPAVEEVGISGSQNTIVKGLRYWTNPSYTRVVIDADNEATYTHRLLKKDPEIHKPQRLYVDLGGCRLDEDITKVIPINDNLLSNVRAGQHTSDSVRVVVDIKSFKTYKIFSLKNPFRIVIDVWGKETEPARRAASTSPKGAKLPPGSLAKQLALGVSRIVIDPGHGGRDFGAPGYLKGVHEKNVVLKIARRLAKKIRAKLGCEVFLTRGSDRHLTLEERTAIANTKNADLFISIHTNAARDRRAYGIETYFLNLATDENAIMVAARENATSTKNISDLQAILTDLMQNAKINESSRLAVHVQETLYKHLKKKYRRINNKGVKQAPFYVLLGAQMPAILIETAFISNSRECKRLINAKYQDQMCEAIIKGIKEYIKETSPTAFIKSRPQSGSAG